jgi:uncharacterized membrane protein
MNRPTQAQLDDFGHRLAALTTEFQHLQRQADEWNLATAEPVAQAVSVEPAQVETATGPYEVPEWLLPLDELVQAGRRTEALRLAGSLRDSLFVSISHYSLPQSIELLDYLERIGDPNDLQFRRLVSSVKRNIEYLGGSRAPTQRPAPAAAGPRLATAARGRRRKTPRLQSADLLGPRALAVAGGIVTLLGIVFFFVLAVNRGWIGPTGRVALGGAAAALVFAGGLELRRRYGTTHAALAAVGAGIGGGYATLLAAALYGLMPNWGALIVAAGIASIGLLTALRWRSQLIAGIGLIGAMLAPVAVSLPGPPSVLGTAFAGIVFVATAVVSIRMDWRALLITGGVASVLQLLVLVGEEKYRFLAPADVLAVAAFFAFVYAGTGVARQLGLKTARLDPIATTFIAGGGLVAVDAAIRLFATSEQRGFAFLAISIVYALAGTYFFLRPATRDLSAFLTFVAFTLGAVAFAELLNGQPLAYAWAAEAAGLSWLARRVREIRFQLWSAVYLLLAGIHVLTIDDEPRRLLDVSAHPAGGVGAAIAVAAAAAVFSLCARPWQTDDSSDRLFADFFARLASLSRELRRAGGWMCLAFAVYALSLAIVAGFSSLAWATVALAGVWMSVGLVVFAAGILRRAPHLRVGALAWLLVTGCLVVEQALRVLGPTPRAWAFAIVGVASLTVSVAYSLTAWSSRLEQADAIAVVTLASALALFTYPIGEDLTGRAQGLALLAVTALFAGLSTLLYRRSSRDFSTLYWIAALGLAAVADTRLLSGTYSVLGWAVVGVSVAALARRVGEPRLYLGAAAFLTLTVGRALIVQAPLSHLFHAQTHPAYGAASIFIAAVAVAIVAWIAGNELDRLGSYRATPWWIAGALVVYGLSLLILELFTRVSHAGLDTEFQRGHTAVSAFWGALGLALLYVGLKRGSRSIRVAGLAFFAISLAKIFLYDLPALSAVTRALSFLAVGAVLLLGGFFYQRLTTSDGEPNHSADHPTSKGELHV